MVNIIGERRLRHETIRTAWHGSTVVDAEYELVQDKILIFVSHECR